MPVGNLNFALLGATYTDAQTVEFPRGRGMFSAQVSNDGMWYKLAYYLEGQRTVSWETTEHHTVQSLLVFDDPDGEGLPPGAKFGGIAVRGVVAGKTRVTVA